MVNSFFETPTQHLGKYSAMSQLLYETELGQCGETELATPITV